ncbi:GntR family transcriptional repressor for pyruvate dehydrogenase complex [Paraburkholderia sp. GAS41]|jgi:GntR family transcriptional repressor for pyruvate dehydrogenase complex|uniref:FadR/GntR family transcriptional regulator n=1 Tax=Paraburkholderia sp. GAS41 TaxID=3035134 RepID=UPI003D1B46C9
MIEHKSPGVSGRVYSDILNRIIDGEYREGERLPSENTLAEHFATSRPTVREALAQLRADGIIATRQGSGTTVRRRPDPDLRRFAPLETLSDVRRCYEFRVMTEVGGASLAAQKADEADLAAIQQAWDNLQQVIRGEGVGAQDDFAFHLAVARASKNQFFITALSFIHEQVESSMNLSRKLSQAKSVERQRLVQAEHLAVVEAIRQRDPRGAERAMREHLANAMERMVGA